MSLHIGDRILEVNGTPLQNHSLEEVSFHRLKILILFQIVTILKSLFSISFLKNMYVYVKSYCSYKVEHGLCFSRSQGKTY